MQATEILTALQEAGATARIAGDKLLVEPGNVVPTALVPEIREHKLEIMELVSQATTSSGVVPTTPCSCDPLPSQMEHGHMAQAGCGSDYERCEACGYRWQCKLCLGCRYCRTPG